MLRKSIWNEVQHHFILCSHNAAQDQRRKKVFVSTDQDTHKGYLRGPSLTPTCSHIYSKGQTRWVICAHLKSSYMWSNILTSPSSPTPVIPSINAVILIILRNLLPPQTTKWNTGDVLNPHETKPLPLRTTERRLWFTENHFTEPRVRASPRWPSPTSSQFMSRVLNKVVPPLWLQSRDLRLTHGR